MDAAQAPGFSRGDKPTGYHGSCLWSWWNLDGTLKTENRTYGVASGSPLARKTFEAPRRTNHAVQGPGRRHRPVEGTVRGSPRPSGPTCDGGLASAEPQPSFACSCSSSTGATPDRRVSSAPPCAPVRSATRDRARSAASAVPRSADAVSLDRSGGRQLARPFGPSCLASTAAHSRCCFSSSQGRDQLEALPDVLEGPQPDGDEGKALALAGQHTSACPKCTSTKAPGLSSGATNACRARFALSRATYRRTDVSDLRLQLLVHPARRPPLLARCRLNPWPPTTQAAASSGPSEAPAGSSSALPWVSPRPPCPLGILAHSLAAHVQPPRDLPHGHPARDHHPDIRNVGHLEHLPSSCQAGTPMPSLSGVKWNRGAPLCPELPPRGGPALGGYGHQDEQQPSWPRQEEHHAPLMAAGVCRQGAVGSGRRQVFGGLAQVLPSPPRVRGGSRS